MPLPKSHLFKEPLEISPKGVIEAGEFKGKTLMQVLDDFAEEGWDWPCTAEVIFQSEGASFDQFSMRPWKLNPLDDQAYGLFYKWQPALPEDYFFGILWDT